MAQTGHFLSGPIGKWPNYVKILHKTNKLSHLHTDNQGLAKKAQ